MSIDLIHTDCVDTFFADGDVESFLPPLAQTAAFEAIAFDPLAESFHGTHGGFSPTESQALHHTKVLHLDMLCGESRAQVSAGPRFCPAFASPPLDDETDSGVTDAEDDAAVRVDAVCRPCHIASPHKRQRKQSVKAASQKRPKVDSAGYHDMPDGRCSPPKIVDYVVPAPCIGASEEDMKGQRAALLTLPNQTLYDILVQLGGPSRHKAKTARRYVVDEILCRLFPDKASTIKSESRALTPKVRKTAAGDQPCAKGPGGSKGTPRAVVSHPRQHHSPEASDTPSSLDPSDSDSSDSDSASDGGSESGADSDSDVERVRCRLSGLTNRQLCDLVISLGGPSKHSHNLAKRLLIDYIINREIRASDAKDLRRLHDALALSHPPSTPHKESDMSGQDETVLAQLAVLFQQVLADMMAHADIRSYTTRIQATCFPVAEGGPGEIETLEALVKKAGEGGYRARCGLERDVDAMLSKTAAAATLAPTELNHYTELVKNVMYQQLRQHAFQIRSLEAALRTPATATASSSAAAGCVEGSEGLGVVVPCGKRVDPSDLAWIEMLGVKYHRGDYAYLRGPVAHGPAWVGRIERIYVEDGKHEVEMRWCTSAEHDKYIRANVRPCGQRELFLMAGPGSVDANSIETLNGKPAVMLTLADGFRKSGRSKDPNAYYVNRIFNTRTKALEPLPRKAKQNSAGKHGGSRKAAGATPTSKAIAAVKSRGQVAHPGERWAGRKPTGPHDRSVGPSPGVRMATCSSGVSASQQWSEAESDENDEQLCRSDAESSAPRSDSHAASATSNSSSGGSPSLFRNHLAIGLFSPSRAGLSSPSTNPPSPPITSTGDVTAALGLIHGLGESNEISRDEEDQWIKLVLTGHEGIIALARYYGSDRSRFLNIARQSFKETQTGPDTAPASTASSTPSQ